MARATAKINHVRKIDDVVMVSVIRTAGSEFQIMVATGSGTQTVMHATSGKMDLVRFDVEKNEIVINGKGVK